MINIISIIVPVYNESKGINLFIEKLNAVLSDSIDTEIIFVDGGSNDDTVDILVQMGYNVQKSDRGRGNQIRQGIAASQGEIILILHADTFFTQSPFEEIQQACQNFKMGAFHIHFDDTTFMMKAVAFSSHMRLLFRRIAFGDQGMFMTREFYNQLGGFEPIALMEDYDFSLRAKQALDAIYVSETPIYSSARRFKKHGIWKMIFIMQKCQHLYRRGVSVEEIGKIYSGILVQEKAEAFRENMDSKRVY